MTNLTDLIKSNINIIQIISYENKRVEGVINKTASDLKKSWYKWNTSSGLKKYNGKNFDIVPENEDTRDVLNWYRSDVAKDSILILEDFDLHLQGNPQLISIMKEIALEEYKDRSLIMLQTKRCLPVELEKEVYIEEMDLPPKKDLQVIFNRVCKDYKVNPEGNIDKIIESALGLTIMEAQRAFSRAIVQTGKLSESEIEIIKEKENIIKNSGYLEYYRQSETLDDIGGLDKLKNWLRRRGRAFEEEAKKYGLETPRGILLLGIPGTGKSLCAKAVGAAWQFPIIKLDMGKVFGGIVGESESNIRKALKIAEAVSPSILWIDEIEKGLAGMQSSGQTDGGTTSRVLGTFLTWMQEKKKPVFVVATANNISSLPPELLRKGRVDEIFFVDLPVKKDREEIIKIHLKRFKRDYNKFDISKIAEACEEFSGAEIEESIKEALFNAFDEDKEITNEHIIEAMKKTYPISKTMKENISDMRRWAKARAVLASSNTWQESEDDKGKPVPRLKQEAYNNDFIK